MERQKEILQSKIYSGAALARWFGISSAWFYRNRDKYLEDLKNYAEYEITDKGKYNITKILIKEPYIKDSEKKKLLIRQFVTRYYPNDFYCILTEEQSEMNNIIGKELDLKESTQYQYLTEAFVELFGRAHKFNGAAGHRNYYYMAYDKNGKRRPMTEEEQKIKKKLLTKWYGDKEENEYISHIEGEYRAGHISEKEYSEELKNISSTRYDGFMQDMETYIGDTVRVHFCEWRVTAFNWLKENGYFTEEQLEYFKENPVLAW